MLRRNGFRLITLGRLALDASGVEDESLVKRRRNLALLAVLALSDRPYTRDVLADMFWGDKDDERARHSLNDALSHLRRVLAATRSPAARRRSRCAPGRSSSSMRSNSPPRARRRRRSPAVEVVAPPRVSAPRTHEDLDDEGALSIHDAIALARHVGATWEVSGGITRGDGLYILDLSVRDVSHGTLVGQFTVTGRTVFAIADRAAAHILAAADAHAPGPRLADVETSNVGAYLHFVRAIQAREAGRFEDQIQNLDAAIAEDSGFVSAIAMRLRLAEAGHEAAIAARLTRAFERASGRATDWDHLTQSAYVAQHSGNYARATALGRELVRRYPHDPRAYSTLANMYAGYGEWGAADTVLQHALALDSLAADAGTGPCAACAALEGLIWVRVTAGDISGAARAARRWVALQPQSPASWSGLATALSYIGRYEPALAAARRALMLAGGNAEYAMRVGRILLMARQYDAADSAIAVWRTRSDDDFRINAADLEVILERERGAYRASVRTAKRAVARYPSADALLLVAGNSLGRLHEWRAAARLYETHLYAASQWQTVAPPPSFRPMSGDGVHAFCWEHALEADAIAASGDTVRLHVLADSIQAVSALSPYGRDWRLAHHVRGLIAMRAGRAATAAAEFERARWGASGWTVTEAELARAQLALGRPHDALATLRAAYEAPPDAMGRYEPRSELDLLMALAFRRAGMPDSSRTYAEYTRHAWRAADPEVKTMLAQLDDSLHATAPMRSLAGVIP